MMMANVAEQLKKWAKGREAMPKKPDPKKPDPKEDHADKDEATPGSPTPEMDDDPLMAYKKKIQQDKGKKINPFAKVKNLKERV